MRLAGAESDDADLRCVIGSDCMSPEWILERLYWEDWIGWFRLDWWFAGWEIGLGLGLGLGLKALYIMNIMIGGVAGW